MIATPISTSGAARWGSSSPPPQLPASGVYLLLSDLHLGDGATTDTFGHKDDELLELIEERAPHVDAIVLNGDVFDSVQARRPADILRAHSRLIRELHRVARTIPIHYIMGNHDSERFVDTLLPSAQRRPALQVGSDTLILHGHQFDTHFGDGLRSGKGNVALWAHARFERLTGQFVRLPFSDHHNLANRFGHWLFYRLTMGAYHAARGLAAMGRPARLRGWAAHHDYWARSQWGDTQALLLPTLNALAGGPYRRLITGHAHQPGLLDRFDAPPPARVSGEPDIEWRPRTSRVPDVAALAGRALVNLGSWTFGQTSYGLWRDGAVEVRDRRSGELAGDRSYSLAMRDSPIPGMREWWERYYRGFLRYDIEQVRMDRVAIA